MKKIALAALMACCIAGAFAKTWTNNLGFGASVPFSVTGVDEKNADDITQLGYGVEGIYLGYHESGFVAKADLSVGVGTTKDIKIQDDGTNIGVFEHISVGAGYAFVRSESFLLAATAMVGLNVASYTNEEDDVPYTDENNTVKADYTQAFSLVSLTAGADLFAEYRISQKFGIFANVGVRYLLVGTGISNWEYEYKTGNKSVSVSDDDTESLFGKFCVQPTLGVMWTF